MSPAPRYPRVVLGTVCIPWAADGALIEDVFCHQVRVRLASGIQHLYVFGTAGEGYAVSDRQFDEVCRLFRDEMRGPDAHAMVGVISLSTTTVIERIERAIDLGFDTFQVSLPNWGTLNDLELATFFREVVGRFPDAGFLHYNLPRAGRILTAADYARLAADHPNLVATKNSTPDLTRIRTLLGGAPMLRHFFTETSYPQGCQFGEPGYLMSLTTMNPALGVRLFDASVRGDLPTLQRLQAEAFDVADELHRAGATVREGGLAAAPHIDGAYEKVLGKVLDDRMPLRLLPPYQPVSEDEYRAFRQRIATRHPTWLPDEAPP